MAEGRVKRKARREENGGECEESGGGNDGGRLGRGWRCPGVCVRTRWVRAKGECFFVVVVVVGVGLTVSHGACNERANKVGRGEMNE